MAAYAALSSLSETTELLLHKIIHQKTTDDDDGVHRRSSRNLLLQQLEGEIQSVLENTNFLRSVLEKSPTHPFEAQMKDAAEQAQAFMERFMLDQLPPELTIDDDVILKSLSPQLQRIYDDLISSMVDKIKSNASDDEESVGIFDSCSSSETLITSADTAVITEELIERLEHLLFDESSTELRVVSIVGMGGIGKTTLASWVYGYALFHRQQQFEIIGYVMASRDISPRDMLVSLAASIKPFIARPMQRNESVENYVHNNLKGRRFLIVLDNVWSPEALRVFMRAIPDDGNRSVILITTRHDEVAVEANPNKPTHTVTMRLRTPDESHDLLQRKVFGDEGCPPDELLDLLRSIAMVCDGLPLALALVAGILRASNHSMHEYKYILEKLSVVEYNSRHEMVNAILALSYIHLPHRLRSCLLYMGAFPEDRHQIYVGRLTKQLSAQCFMRKSTSPDMEQCLHDLVDRNLVLLLAWKPDSSAKSVRIMNDMVRDFCLKKAREEKLLHCVKDDESLTTSKIKVSFNLDNLKRICNSDDADYDTHTIICFGSGWTRSRSLISVGRFRLLKSLDLENVEIESFPNEVLNLTLLRLLALGHVPELPQSISNLRYLETMIVNDAKDASSSSSSMITLPRILCVPSEIWTMSRLRHIVSFCCGALASPNKQESSPLENLETLSAVMNLDCSEDLIEMIPNVKKLGIFYFGVERGTHSIENIERLSRLEKLKVWVMVPFSAPQNLNLGFPATLRRLTLRGLRLSHRDMLVIGRLPRLQALKLIQSDFEGGEWRVTAACGLEKLEFLMVAESGLRRWLCDNGGGGFVFPMLHTLVIRACKELNEIEHVVRNIPSLEIIIIWSCNKSLVESASRVRESNENIKVFIR